MKRLFDWIINTFSYTQIYFFFGLLLLLSLFPIIFFWIETHIERLSLIDEQYSELLEFSELKKLYDSVQEHRLLSSQYSNDQLQETRDRMIQIEEYIRRQIFESGGPLDPNANHTELTNSGSAMEKVRLFNHAKRWKDILDHSSHFPPEVIEYMHTALLQDINLEFGYVAERTGINYFEKNNQYIFTQSVFLIIISIDEITSKLILLSNKLLNHSYSTPVAQDLIRNEILANIDIIQTNLNFLNSGVEKYILNQDLDSSEKGLIALIHNYSRSLEVLISLINQRVLHQPEPNITFDEFQQSTRSYLIVANQLWDELLNMKGMLYKTERKKLVYHFWLILLLSISLIALAFLLEFILTYSGIKRLSQLTQATNNFTNGQLDVRVPEVYQDEIGHQAHAFNRMAQKLEELVKNLFELINATSALAKGKLTTRIPTLEKDQEFNRVAQSFNMMAETFETIMGRLQEIGFTLTTSASEIASASKEQETIVVEQEATTREIAIAAHEISSTAKEFAITMNGVSQAAEQTSDLALKGKGSLHNMEAIMHNMVDASGKIANKLAILNEKAGNITSVITTITKVADQTNLLSLNASIEAEKAGEYGRSFAVIAREIRRLADQTALATLDIEKMVNEIMSAVSSSVMGVDDFNKEIRNGVEQVQNVSAQLATIIEQVQSFTSRFEIVNQGMQAQSTGAEQINEAISQLSLTARQTTEAIHQFQKTVQGLNQAAQELNILNPFNSR